MADERKSFQVAGMSCEHCAAAVREEVAELAGVGAVEVDVGSGELVVRGSGVDDEAVRAAVESAGYSLVAGG